MTGNSNRGRINCAPLTAPRIHGKLSGLPKTMTALAYLYEFYPMVPYAVLVEINSTGRLCEWSGGGIRMLDQRKAAAALTYMHHHEEAGHDWRRAPWWRKRRGEADNSGDTGLNEDAGIPGEAGEADGGYVP